LFSMRTRMLEDTALAPRRKSRLSMRSDRFSFKSAANSHCFSLYNFLVSSPSPFTCPQIAVGLCSSPDLQRASISTAPQSFVTRWSAPFHIHCQQARSPDRAAHSPSQTHELRAAALEKISSGRMTLGMSYCHTEMDRMRARWGGRLFRRSKHALAGCLCRMDSQRGREETR
ncbi:hypothetical protein PENTCL1PPCAC_14680, partial [Pristionchus entomophagus]